MTELVVAVFSLVTCTSCLASLGDALPVLSLGTGGDGKEGGFGGRDEMLAVATETTAGVDGTCCVRRSGGGVVDVDGSV